MVMVAALLVAVPHALFTTRSYDPASPTAAGWMTSVAVSAPEIVPPLTSGWEFRRHWYVGDVPPPSTESVMVEPTMCDPLIGGRLMYGARSEAFPSYSNVAVGPMTTTRDRRASNAAGPPTGAPPGTRRLHCEVALWNSQVS